MINMHSFSIQDKTVTFQYENAGLHVSISQRSLINTPVLRSHYSKAKFLYSMAVFLKNRSYLHQVLSCLATTFPNILTLPTRRGTLCCSSQAPIHFSPSQPASLPSSPSDWSSYHDSSKPQGQKSRLLLRTLVKKH